MEKHTPSQLIIIDPSVLDSAQLLQQLPAASTAVVLQEQIDQIDQISTLLKQYKGLTALHIVTHGSPGALHFSDTTLSNETLNLHWDQLTGWSAAMSDGADILLYGCETGKGQSGQQLIKSLSKITDCNIAAAEQLVGHNRLDAQWQLNSNCGVITTPVFANIDVQKNWLHHLAATINAADLAVVGHNGASGQNAFALVALADILGGSEIFITNAGWDDTGFNFAGNSNVEDVFKFTVAAGGLSAGTLIRFTNAADHSTLNIDNGTQGTVSSAFGSGDMFQLAGSQIFIYQTDNGSYDGTIQRLDGSGSSEAGIIYGFHTDIGTSGATDANGWLEDVGNPTSAESEAPTNATILSTSDGTGNASTANANGMLTQAPLANDGAGEQNSYIYAGPTTATDKAGWLTRIHTTANWNGSASDYDMSSGALANDWGIGSANTAPAFNSGTSFSVDETSTDTTTVLLDVQADNGDGGSNDAGITYSITGGTGQHLFAIDSDDGEIRLNATGASTLDTEAASSYTLEIQADDGESSNNTDIQTITVTVSDIAPAITAGQTFSVNESTSDGASIGTVANTGDTDTVTWSIQSGNTNSAFAISNTGEITLADTSQLDASVTGSYTLTVRADDGNEGVQYSEETVTINVTDDVNPTVSSIALSGTPAANASSVDFTVTFDESVTGVDTSDFELTNTGNAAGNIASISGSGTTYTVTVDTLSGAGDIRLDLKGTGTGIDDGAGNAPAAYTSGSGHTVDQVGPAVTSVSVPLNGTYKAGETLDFTVNFDDNITLTGTSSTLGLTIGSSTVDAVYQGKAATYITYRYTVQANDLDSNGIVVGAITLNGDTIRDASGNDADLTLKSVGSTAAVLVDAVPPGTPAGTLAVDENSANSTAVGTVTSTDATAFTLTDNADGRFAIDNSGNVTVANGSLLDRETQTSHDITVQATDAAGNTSTQTLAVTINNVNEAPAASNKTLTAQKDTALIITASDLGYSDPEGTALDHITINTALAADTLWVDTDGDGTLNGPETALTNNSTVSLADISANKLKFLPDTGAVGTGHATIDFTVNDGALDASSQNTWTIDVVSAPEIDLNGAAAGNNVTGISYTENDLNIPVSLVAVDASITDDDADLTSLSIQITDGAEAEDVIKLNGYNDGDSVHGITIEYTSDSEIALTGTASKADYTALLTELNFAQTGNNVGGGDRTISVTGTDANSQTGLASTITVSVTGINDKPTLTATGTTPTFTEDGASVDLFNTVTLSTVESGQTVQQLVLTVTNVTDKTTNTGDQEFLIIDGSDVALNNSNSVTTTHGHTAAVSLTGSTATITLTGNNLNATAAQTLIDSLKYKNTDNDPTTTANRVVSITGIQDSGGTDNGGIDADNSLSGISATVNLQATNDAPTTADTTESVSYNGSYTFQISDFAFTDSDTGDTLDHISINSLPDKGILKRDGNAVSLNEDINAADIAANKLTYTPDSGGTGAGYSSFLFSVNDGTAESGSKTVTLNVGARPAPPAPPAPEPETETETELVDGVTVETVTTTENGKTVSKVTVEPVTDDREDTDNSSTEADIPLHFDDNDTAVTTVSLPQGVGMTAYDNTTARENNGIADLISMINNVASIREVNAMTTGGRSFLSLLASDQSDLWANEITLTTNSDTPPAAPITIQGSSETGNGYKEALVIDASNLPEDSVLDLKDVEFAVIVGPASLTGGEGANIVYAGGGSQHIVLGEDDDELHGGDGDDTVGSKGGDDLIFGDAGNDTIFGGAGKDQLHGGLDNDTATFDGNRADYEVVQTNGVITVTSKTDSTDVDTLINIEQIQFADQTETFHYDSELEALATLYGNVLGRQADLGGFQWWADSVDNGLTLGGVAANILRSAEAEQRMGSALDSLSAEDQIEAFYTEILGRASDAEGKAHWVNALNNGASLEQIAEGFVRSVELTGQYLSAEEWDFTV